MTDEENPPPSSEKPTLLVVDDDEVFRTQLIRAFERRGFEVRGAANAQEAVEASEIESPELATVDLRMPGRSGLELVGDLLELDPTTNIVVLTGYGSIATALEAVRLGATHYLTKPADVDEILAAFGRREGAPEAATVASESRVEEADVPTLARVEWEHINRVLTDCGGNISLAAKRLGIHRRSLQRKLAKYPVNR